MALDSSEITFFTAEPLMYDSGAGFDYFGPAHLGYLACSVVLIGVLCAAYRRLPSGTAWGSPRRTMQLVIAAIPLAMLASRDVMMYHAGVFDPNWWPLHSCNICELLMLVYALRPNRLCGESLATMGIFGALAALLFPSWSYCPPFTWPSVCGFTEHTLIVAFTAMVITGRDYEPSVKHIWMPLVLFGLYVPAAYAFNKAFDTNFMFLNAPPGGSPLVAVAELFGSAGYIVPLVVVVIACWLALYALWRVLLHHVEQDGSPDCTQEIFESVNGRPSGTTAGED